MKKYYKVYVTSDMWSGERFFFLVLKGTSDLPLKNWLKINYKGIKNPKVEEVTYDYWFEHGKRNKEGFTVKGN